MDSRQTYKPPHQSPENKVNRYFEFLMSYTYRYPSLMNRIVKLAGAASLALMASPLAGGGKAAFLFGAAGLAVSAVSYVAQHYVFSFPLKHDECPYQEAELNHNNQKARGKLIIREGQMPLLRIDATNHYDAGYVQGFLLAPAIRHVRQHMNGLFSVLKLFFGNLESNRPLVQKLSEVMEQIPEAFREEMTGKLIGYNTWLAQHYPNEKSLSKEEDLIMQLLPDLRNFNPFPNANWREKIFQSLHGYMPGLSCTSIVLRLQNMLFATRILDWPSQGLAKYILQIERHIDGELPFTDICVPTFSGAVTAFNGMSLHINVAHGPEVREINGMPAVFFNRWCIGRARCVADIDEILKQKQPLGAYHMTVVGDEARSYHFYQDKVVYGDHVVEKMPPGDDKPQLLVVSNKGVRYVNNIPKDDNHRDSKQRIANVNGFFEHASVLEPLQGYLKKLEAGEQLTETEIMTVMNICLEAARLPLVNNNESVLCAQFYTRDGQVQKADAICDNLYAQQKGREEFKTVTLPGM